MKLVRRFFLFLTGRWLRLLVWLPLAVLAVLCTGATMQALGVKLSLAPSRPIANNFAIPVIRYLDKPSTKPIHGDNIAQPRMSSGSAPVMGNNFSLPASPPGFSGTPNYHQAYPIQNYGAPAQPINHPNLPSTTQTPFPPQTYTTSNAPAAPLPMGQPSSSGQPLSGQPLSGQPFSGQPLFSMEPANTDPNIAEMTRLSQTIRSMQASDGNSIRDRLSELVNLAIQHFDNKQSLERDQLKAAKESLAIWEEAISQRDSLKKPLIESHIAQLLQSPDLLNWSFSGAELLKVNSKEANYTEIVRKLWPTLSNQGVSPDSSSMINPAEDHPAVIDPADLPPVLEALPMTSY